MSSAKMQKLALAGINDSGPPSSPNGPGSDDPSVAENDDGSAYLTKAQVIMQPPPPPEGPSEFKLPDGYSVKWRINGAPGKPTKWGYVLISPDHEELGFFESREGRSALWQVLKDHLRTRITGNLHKRIADIVERGGVALVDSSGGEVAFRDVSPAKKHTPNQALGNMIEDLGKRQ